MMWILALGSTAKPITEGRLGAVVRHGAVGAGMALPLSIGMSEDDIPKPESWAISRKSTATSHSDRLEGHSGSSRCRRRGRRRVGREGSGEHSHQVADGMQGQPEAASKAPTSCISSTRCEWNTASWSA